MKQNHFYTTVDYHQLRKDRHAILSIELGATITKRNENQFKRIIKVLDLFMETGNPIELNFDAKMLQRQIKVMDKITTGTVLTKKPFDETEGVVLEGLGSILDYAVEKGYVSENVAFTPSKTEN